MKNTRKHFSLAVALTVTTFVAFSSSASAQEAKRKPIVRYFVVTRDSVGHALYPNIPNRPYDTVRVRRYWSELKRGMTEKEVTKLLGSAGVYQWDGENALNYWWYGNRTVVFNAMTKKVTGWDK